MIAWQWLDFSELSLDQLYSILSAREQVFTLEQRVTCEDIDGLDREAFHLLGLENGSLVAYARVLSLGVYFTNAVSFGRLIIVRELRGKGYGKKLMQEIMSFIRLQFPDKPIKFSAQCYLQKFYEDFGFEVCSEIYDEGGVPQGVFNELCQFS